MMGGPGRMLAYHIAVRHPCRRLTCCRPYPLIPCEHDGSQPRLLGILVLGEVVAEDGDGGAAYIKNYNRIHDLYDHQFVILSFYLGNPRYQITAGIITILGFIVILVLSESFNNLSLGKVLSLSRKVEEKEIATIQALANFFLSINDFGGNNQQPELPSSKEKQYFMRNFNSSGPPSMEKTSNNIEQVFNNLQTVDCLKILPGRTGYKKT